MTNILIEIVVVLAIIGVLLVGIPMLGIAIPSGFITIVWIVVAAWAIIRAIMFLRGLKSQG